MTGHLVAAERQSTGIGLGLNNDLHLCSATSVKQRITEKFVALLNLTLCRSFRCLQTCRTKFKGNSLIIRRILLALNFFFG